MKRLMLFCKKNKETIIVAVSILFAFLVCSAIWGVFPFGTKTIATCDAYYQELPLLNLIFDFLEGKASLFYTTTIGGGINTFAVFAYYLISPFSIFYFILGRAGIFYAFNIALILKLTTIGILASVFIKKTFKNIEPLFVIIFSLAYTLGGFTVFIFSFLVWLDFLIYMPLLYLAFKKFIDTKKTLPLSIMLSVFIYTCFGIGSFSFFILLIVFGLYIVLCIEKESQKEYSTLLVKAFLVAIAIALPIIVPCFISFVGGARAISFFSEVFRRSILTNFPTKMVIILMDGIMLIFGIKYLLTLNYKEKENRFWLYTTILLLFPVFVDGSLCFLNMGAYLGYLCRLGFVWSFFLLLMACRHANNKSNFPEKKGKLYFEVAFIVVGVVVALLLFFSYRFFDFSLTDFSGIYASLELFLYLSLAAMGIAFFLILLGKCYKKGDVGAKLYKTVVAIVGLIVICFNIIVGFFFVLKESPEVNKNFFADTSIESGARVKNFDTDISNNMVLNKGITSLSAFSSCLPASIFDVKQNFGYQTTITMVSSEGGTILTDALFGYKYLTSTSLLDRPYLSYVDTIVADSKTVYIYENKFAFDNAMVLNDFEIETFDEDIILNNNKLFRALGGEGDFLYKFDITDERFNCEYVNCTQRIEGNKVFYNRIDMNLDSYIEYEYTATEACVLLQTGMINDYSLFYYSFSKDNFDDAKCVDMQYGFTDFSFLNPNETIYLRRSIESSYTITEIKENPEYFVITDYKKVENLLSDLKSKSTPVTFHNEKKITKLSTNVDNDNSMLLIAMPYLDNYTITINGEEVEYCEMLGGFIGVNLKNGNNDINMVYHSPIGRQILIGIILGMVILLLVYLIFKYCKKFVNHVSIYIHILYVSVMIIMILFFYFTPLVIGFL